MLHVVYPPDRSIADTVEELRDRIAEAYTQVTAARQALADLPTLPDLPTHLQTAEAELVRASVALGKIDLGAFRGASGSPQPHRPVIPFDVERGSGYEYGS